VPRPTKDSPKAVSAAEKKAFLELLGGLPRASEFFYTKEAIDRAAPHTRVLLALTEKDVERYAKDRGAREPSLYPFLALSRGLLDRKDQRTYGVKHFGSIAHPVIKLVWGAILFHEKEASPEIIRFLRAALKSKEQASILSQMLGPGFNEFEKRLREHPLADSHGRRGRVNARVA
jgi:hypothetical protein